MLNETTRNQFIKDLNGLVQLPADIIKAISITSAVEGSNFLDNLVGTLRNTDANLIKYQEMNKKYQELNSTFKFSPLNFLKFLWFYQHIAHVNKCGNGNEE